MSVSFDVQLPLPRRQELTTSLRAALERLPGDWHVSAIELHDSPDWHVRLEGSNGFIWTRTFSGPDEQTMEFVRQTIASALSLSHPPSLSSIEIRGFGPFQSTVIHLRRLQVLVGANGSGKTSFFDFLQAIREFVRTEIPPAIIHGWETREVFHRPGPDRLSWDIAARIGDRDYHFQATIHGPAGSPSIEKESITVGDVSGRTVAELSRIGDRGAMSDSSNRQSINLTDQRPNQLALRRYVSPAVPSLQPLSEAIESWRFFSGSRFNDDQMRRPALVEDAPALREDGGNLAAVIHWLQTAHREILAEVESLVRRVVPAFRQLSTRLSGAGRVTLDWYEDGLVKPLTAADLSDGSLRLLLWVTLALAPNPPTLVCIDEPELGLHPRTLPTIAALLRKLSDRAQVLVATHSSYFLAQFDVVDVGVMRKTGGAVTLSQPADSKALRANLEEFGSEELELMHRSDELEALI